MELAQPTGEQLYILVTRGFQSGSFPWSMVSASGKAAWEAAAAQLVFHPDTIMSAHVHQGAIES